MLAISINQLHPRNIIFGKKMKNNIMEDSDYVSIIYSTPTFTMSNLCFSFMLVPDHFSIKYNRCKMIFNSTTDENDKVIQLIKKIEYTLLTKYSTKTPVLHLGDAMQEGHIKVHNYNEKNTQTTKELPYKRFVMKISGIWETLGEVGIIYKCYLL